MKSFLFISSSHPPSTLILSHFQRSQEIRRCKFSQKLTMFISIFPLSSFSSSIVNVNVNYMWFVHKGNRESASAVLAVWVTNGRCTRGFAFEELRGGVLISMRWHLMKSKHLHIQIHCDCVWSGRLPFPFCQLPFHFAQRHRHRRRIATHGVYRLTSYRNNAHSSCRLIVKVHIHSYVYYSSLNLYLSWIYMKIKI